MGVFAPSPGSLAGFVGSQIAGSWSPVGGWSGYWPQCPAGSGGGDATVVISGNPAATYCTAVMTLNSSNWVEVDGTMNHQFWPTDNQGHQCRITIDNNRF